MSWWQGLVVMVVVVGLMEVAAYVTHRWVMHGFLWILHKSHHEPHPGCDANRCCVDVKGCDGGHYAPDAEIIDPP